MENGCLLEEPNWICVLAEEMLDNVSTQKESSKKIYIGFLKADIF
jgi:hypothetical protein